MYIFDRMQWAYLHFKYFMYEDVLHRDLHMYPLLCSVSELATNAKKVVCANQSASVPRVWCRSPKHLTCSVHTYWKGRWVSEWCWLSNCLSSGVSLSLFAYRRGYICKYCDTLYSVLYPQEELGHEDLHTGQMLQLYSFHMRSLKKALPQIPATFKDNTLYS